MEEQEKQEQIELRVGYRGEEIILVADLNTANIILNDPDQADELIEQILQTQGGSKNISTPPGGNEIWVKRKPDNTDIKATEDFLQLRKKHEHQFVDKKLSHTTVYNKIAKELQHVGYDLGANGGQKCLQKFNNLQKQYMAYRKHITTTGTEKKHKPPYYDLMHSILGGKDKAFPTKSTIDSLDKPALSLPITEQNEEVVCVENEREVGAEPYAESVLEPELAPAESQPSTSRAPPYNVKTRFRQRRNVKATSKVEHVLKFFKDELEKDRHERATQVAVLQEQLDNQSKQRDKFLHLMKLMVTGNKGHKRKHSSSSSESSDL